MDGRIPRLWYLAKEWRGPSKVPSVEDYLNKPDLLQNTIDWQSISETRWCQIEKAPHIFLSRSPLTFGHSQLVVPSSKDNEECLFQVASKIIYIVISTFRKVFGCDTGPIHEKDEFRSLAVIRNTLVLNCIDRTGEV